MELTPDQIKQIQQLINDGQLNTDGRSPLKPRQLHDLRLLPTATDPRPTFFWSAESPRDGTAHTTTEYPKLLWHGTTNTEITVLSRQEEQQKLASGYVTLPITSVVVDQVQTLAEQLAGLSEEDRAFILEAQQRSRREALTAKLAGLSDADLESLLATQAKPAKKRAVA